MTAREVDKHVARIIGAPVELRKKFLSRLVDSVMLDDRAFLAGLLKLWDKTSTSEGTSGGILISIIFPISLQNSTNKRLQESTAEPPAPKRTKRDHPDGGSGGLSDHHRYLPPALEGGM